MVLILDDFLRNVDSVNKTISRITWGPTTLIFVLFVGFWFSYRLNFFQFTKVRLWCSITFGSFLGKKKDIKSKKTRVSPLQAVSTALAGSVGTGNIVGVAVAVMLGGPGALFWMWVAAILGMMTSFAENVLAVKYKEKDKNGYYYGGPMFYMEKALDCKWLAMIFSVACIGVTFGMGNMIQSNSIANSIHDSLGISPLITGLITAAIAGIIVLGSIDRIIKVTDKLVPVMVGLYLIGGLLVILCNLDKLGEVMLRIIQSAFDFRPVGGSIVGCSAIGAMKYGISRGLFSNEAGLGSSPIVHATTDITVPAVQGMWGIFQVFIDTILVCSITGFCVLITGCDQTVKNPTTVTSTAFSSVLGNVGGVMVCIILIFFAFSTIIGWSYFGERCVSYLVGERHIGIYKLSVPFVIVIGATMNLELLWEICDNLNVFMMVPNLLAILLLSKQVVALGQKALNSKGGRDDECRI